ncbi:Carnitine O-acetyltransferase mitochondrial [Coemansia javaensis]|uniref:Carnitine O-acetyltransferase, mitochondrial n=1 Tax=Coemansia javaensis TaxID=2761396 RepID=A0A9W8HJL6_9FUNG|nr:Carnitine O-acetyltransferase mitochondrial [Coemansia javaensis]
MPTASAGASAPRHELGKLFAQQARLPRLPVPDLESTLAKYAESLEPLLGPGELARSKRLIREFGQSARARELQSRLEARAAEPGRANWLEEWWNDLSYMGYRDPVIPFVSYHYSFKDDPACTRPTQRAARLIAGAIAFRQMVVDGSLPPDMARTDPLCSHSYKFMFNACRVPGIPSDHCRTADYSGNESVVVARNGQFFVFSFVRNGAVLGADEIEATLDRIVEEADSSLPVPVGLLTADGRDAWTRARELLLRVAPENAEALDQIESSAFLVSLEKDRPATREELSRAIWHGDGRSRWFDKPCQFVVCDNARAGFCGEHSMMDGTPTLRLVDYVVAHSLQAPRGAQPPARPADFCALRFHTPAPVVAAVSRAGNTFRASVAKQHLRTLLFTAYGKETIKELGCSPDAYVQMLIQLAHFRLHGRVRPTYEASMTRRFLHGRTETCRSATCESAAWCHAMADPAADGDTRARLLRAALAKHSKLAREAADGRGVDRHLLGLRMLVSRGEPMPSIFEDPAYSYSSHWFLSTSQISSENLASYGWSEVTPRGYGVAYSILKGSLFIHVTCLRNEHGLDADRFVEHFEAAALDVRDMLAAQAQQQTQTQTQ